MIKLRLPPFAVIVVAAFALIVAGINIITVAGLLQRGEPAACGDDGADACWR